MSKLNHKYNQKVIQHPSRLHSFVSANVDSSSGHIQEPHSANPSESPHTL